MKLQISTFIFLLFFLVSCKNSSNAPNFELLDASETGIEFNNEINESNEFNPLNFIYIYNGAGVGVIDINNDSLPDLFFAGNKVSSKLYMNKGGLKFDDVTETAGVSTNNWATGVSIVDINADGLQDIYLCMADKDDPEKGRNQLFVNQGDNTFKESASTYGIDDNGYSTQAVFFDYDNDGDLDLYILTNAVEIFSHNTMRPIKEKGDGLSTDRLYRNNGDYTFTNVSEQAGITIEGYGLGVGIIDVNHDGFDDIYCANDFITNDLLWVNNGDGTFTNLIKDYVSQSSYNGMGMDIADINNDGLLDIVEMDMLPESNYHHKTMTPAMAYNNQTLRFNLGYMPQYVRNSMQLRNEGSGFSEVGRLAQIHKTDWSWAPLLFDFDNDGKKDLFISNGYGKDVTDLDYTSYSKQVHSNPFGTPETKEELEYENFSKLKPINLPNYFFKNTAEFPMEDISASISTKPGISNGAVYVDLDLDGDMDLVTNNMNGPAFVYQNKTKENGKINNNHLSLKLSYGNKNPFGLGTQIRVYHNGNMQFAEQRPVRGYTSSVAYGLHFGLGSDSIVDSLLVKWPNNKIEKFTRIKANKKVTLVLGDGKSRKGPLSQPKPKPLFKRDTISQPFIHKENNYVDFLDQPLLLRMISREGPSLAVADLDSNGLDDVVMGKSYGDTTYIDFQESNGQFSKKKPLPESWRHEDAGTAIFDVNNDGLKDIYMASGGNEFRSGDDAYRDRLYLQTDVGDFQLLYMDQKAVSSSTVNAADFDGDGDIDVFVGARLNAQKYPMADETRLLLNENGRLIDKTKELAPELQLLGMVTSALWTDFNADGTLDLIVVGEWMSPHFFENKQGRLELKEMDRAMTNLTGLWNSINGADLDQDGDIDYVLGNYGLNTELKASVSEPIEIIAKDFDGNGSIDPIIGHYSQGIKYPFATRDAITTQINGLKKRFPSYKSYASATFEDLFTKKEREGALKKQVTTLATGILENKGNGTFNFHELPYQAQQAPVFGTSISFLDDDEHPDLILIGNRTDTETLGGFLDGSYGAVLMGDGTLKFGPRTNAQSGFTTQNKDSRSLAFMYSDNEPKFLVGNNNDTSNMLQVKSKRPYVICKPADVKISFSFKNEKTLVKELYLNQGYLSQSSEKISLPNGAVSAIIYSSDGTSRDARLYGPE